MLLSLFPPTFIARGLIRQNTARLGPRLTRDNVDPIPKQDPPPFVDNGPKAPEPETPGLARRLVRTVGTGLGMADDLFFQPKLPKSTGQLFGASRPTQGNTLKLLVDGKEFRGTLVEQINNAKTSIWINFYLVDLKSDSEVQKALLAAAARGVRIRLLTDNREGARAFVDPSVPWSPSIQALKKAGADVARSKTDDFGINHRKMAIFDGQRAVVAGYNLTENYLRDKPDAETYHDAGVLLAGPAVRDVAKVYGSSWKDATGHTLPLPPRTAATQGAFSDATVTVLRHDMQADRNIERNIIDQIDNARRSIRIANPNAITDEIENALIRAVKRNVDVEWVWGEQRSAMENVISLKSVKRMMNAGVRVYRYPHKHHLKAYVFDDNKTIIGSSNLDHMATYQNDEASLLIESKTFASETRRRIFGPDARASKRIYTVPEDVTSGSKLKDFLFGGVEHVLDMG